MRATRFAVAGSQLADLLSPPYDVIDDAERAALLARDPRNIVRLILPGSGADASPDYAGAARALDLDLAEGVLVPDDTPALYVYEMAPAGGPATRGLLGAVLLHDYADRVIFPHEDTMAGPVADRLALMEATQSNLEPIYLIYDGGGAATAAVAEAAEGVPIADAQLPDGARHRLWRIVDPEAIDRIRRDLATQTAVIADGHHRYATYLELQRRAAARSGPGPWDRGLALVVDSTSFGPQVDAIHRVVPDLDLGAAITKAGQWFDVERLPLAPTSSAEHLLGFLERPSEPRDQRGFAVVMTDGADAYLLRRSGGATEGGEVTPADRLSTLDVSVVHHELVEQALGRRDTVDSLLYAHTAQEAIDLARLRGGIALLLRATPVGDVIDLARAGLRMPRKSTLFLPKPASGMVLRLFAHQPTEN